MSTADYQDERISAAVVSFIGEISPTDVLKKYLLAILVDFIYHPPNSPHPPPHFQLF